MSASETYQVSSSNFSIETGSNSGFILCLQHYMYGKLSVGLGPALPLE